jgi:transcriptional regulator with GAF, ATPase, and Fis domain
MPKNTVLKGFAVAAPDTYNSGDTILNSGDTILNFVLTSGRSAEIKYDVPGISRGENNGASASNATEKKLACQFVREYGFSLAETARQLGVSTSAVARMLERNE